VKSNAQEVGAKRIVIDPITTLMFQYPDVSERRNAVLDLFEAIVDLGITGLITTELRATALERDIQAEEFLSHGVIVFHTFSEGGKMIRAVQIEKMRGIDHDHELRPYKISKNGIEIFSKESVLLST
jgi:KaiC/GvpD/RAD55 family RecA-like ATPase